MIRLPALRKIFQIGLLLLVALVVAALLAIALGIRVNLNPFRPQLQSAVTERLGRQVRVEGNVSVKLGLRPTLTALDIRVSNPSGWSDDHYLAHIDRLRVQLSALALLKFQIRLHGIEATNSTVALEKRGGKVNWILHPKPTKLRLVSIDRIALLNSRVTYKEPSTRRNYTLLIRRVDGSASAGEPVRLTLEGTVQGQTFTGSARGGPLAELRAAAKSWPIQAEVTIAGASLKARGQFRPLDLQLTLAGEKLAELGSLSETEVPKLGAYKLIGRLSATETGYRLSHLRAKLAGTEVLGTLAISDIKRRPCLSADLAIGTLNAKPFLAARQHAPKSRGRFQNGTRDREIRALLEKIRANVVITIQRVSGLPIDVRRAGMQLIAHDGSLEATLSGTFSEIPLRGHVKLGVNSTGVKLQGTFTAEDTDISQLSRLVTNKAAISGNIARVEARISASSPELASLGKALNARMALNGAKLSYRGRSYGPPLRLTLDDAALALGYRQPTKASASGTLQGKPFSITLSGGEAGAFVGATQWPVELAASGAGAQVQVKGHIAPSAKFVGSNLALGLSGGRISELAPLIGVSSSANLPYRLEGTLSVSQNALTFRIRAAGLGSTALSGTVGQKNFGAKPVLFATLSFQTMVLTELKDVLGSTKLKEVAQKPLNLDLPILPQHMRLPDADIKMTAAHVRLGQREIHNVAVSSEIRSGWLSPAPFSATVEGQLLTGRFSVDLRGTVPKAGLKLVARHADIGKLLRAAGITKDVSGSVALLRAEVDAQGATLRQLLSGSSASLFMNDTQLMVRGPDIPGTLQVRVPEAKCEAVRNQPTTIAVQGSVNKKPIRISLHAGGLRTLERPVQFVLNADLEETHLGLDGILARPLLHKTVTAKISLAGQHLEMLSGFLPTTLPPIGSYSVRALLHSDGQKFALSDVNLKVGSSNLNGNLSLDTANVRPRLKMSLYGKTLQLDDFPLGKKMPDRGESPPKESPAQSETRQVTAVMQRIFSELDGELALRVTDLRSGTAQLGKFQLKATLKNGRSLIKPLQLQKPGSSARLTLVLQQTRTGVSAELRSVIKNLAYGPLAHWFAPEADYEGVVNLNTHLTSQAPNVGELLQHAYGHFDLGIRPEHYPAGIFNLWAVNLITTILPLLDPSESTVNCVAGTFNMVDGDIGMRTFLIDTTKVQVKGEGHIDLNADKIDLKFKPRAKRLQFVNLGTPVNIRGSIEQFRLGVNIKGLIGTAIRLGSTFYMPFTVPFTILFYGRLPANDTEACKAAMQRTEEPR